MTPRRALIAAVLAGVFVAGIAGASPTSSRDVPVWRVSPFNRPEMPRQLSLIGDSDFAVSSQASGLAPDLSRAISVQQLSCGSADDSWQRSNYQIENGAHRVLWSRAGCEVDIRLEGEIEFTADFLDIAGLGSDALVRVEENDRGTERRLEITPAANGAPVYRYRVDGENRPFDTAARAWFSELLVQVFRRGGAMAEERVAWLLREGGIDGVMRELELLRGDFVYSRYAEELLEQADLSDAQAVTLLDQTRLSVDSDFYMSEVLDAVSARYLDSDVVLAAFIANSRTIGSDHYRSEILASALDQEILPPARVAEVLRSAVEIDSDFYLSRLLESIGDRYALQPELREDFLSAVESIDSDHYRSEVLATLLARTDLEAAELAVVLRAAGGVDSDHYRTEILTDVSERDLLSSELRLAYLSAAREIDSDHYRTVALANLLEREDLAEAELVEVIRAAQTIDSDHYKADLLLELLGRYYLEVEAREAFLDALGTIESRQYRGRVADELLQGERGRI